MTVNLTLKKSSPFSRKRRVESSDVKRKKDKGVYRFHSLQEIRYKQYCFTWFKLSAALKVTLLSTWTWDKASEAGDHSYLFL